MRYVKILGMLMLLLTVCSAASLKKEGKKVYAFGVAASFTDTVLYYTGIQELDSVRLKDGFLPNRNLYTDQLRLYVEDNGLQVNSTCMIYFSYNRKKLEKEASKLMSKYKKNSSLLVKKLEESKFRFVKPAEE